VRPAVASATVTDDLYSRDAYLATCEATVTEISDVGVVLDRTVFYPRGGGQPGDSGLLRWSERTAAVTDTTKDRATGGINHAVNGQVPPVGAIVTCELDWPRRYTHMRTHTALHAMSGVIFREHAAKVTGGNIESGGIARMDFELEAMSAELGREVEAKLNQLLADDRPIHVLFLPRVEALADPDLIRTKINLVPESIDPIRVIDIEGIDKQADGGTHVRSTGEIGPVRVVKTESKGKGNKRMRIRLDPS
jgi:misacylated tRNA(Ala) deacylase